MTRLRLAMVAALALAAAVGCTTGPQRASDIQNLHAISDDISAVGMTRSEGTRVHDPNLPTTLPTNYQLPP
jgi:hypothetical protein